MVSSTLLSRWCFILMLSSESSLKNNEIWVIMLTDCKAFLYSFMANSWKDFLVRFEFVNCFSSTESASKKWTSSDRLMYACSMTYLYSSLLDCYETSNIKSLTAFSIMVSTIYKYP